MVLIAVLNTWQEAGLYEIKYSEEVVDFSMSTLISGMLAPLTTLTNTNENRKNGQGWGRTKQ